MVDPPHYLTGTTERGGKVCRVVFRSATPIVQRASPLRPAAGSRTGVQVTCPRDALAAFKIPSLWELRDEPLPRNPSGKVLKNVLTGETENRFVED